MNRPILIIPPSHVLSKSPTVFDPVVTGQGFS
jgi:hypothetical protein